MIAREDARHLTVEEWRELERRSHDAKHEYIDGQVYAMAGGSLAHGRIAVNALRAIEDALALAGTPCNVYNPDVAARLSARRSTAACCCWGCCGWSWLVVAGRGPWPVAPPAP